MESDVGFHFTGRAWDYSYPLMLGMEGAVEGCTKLGKDTPVGPEEGLLLSLLFVGSSLNEAVMR